MGGKRNEGNGQKEEKNRADLKVSTSPFYPTFEEKEGKTEDVGFQITVLTSEVAKCYHAAGSGREVQ